METEDSNPVEDFIQAIFQGSRLLQQGDLGKAERAFTFALQLVQELPPDQAQAMLPLVTCRLGLLRQRQNESAESAKLLAITRAILDAELPPVEFATFHILMAEALIDVAEHRRAIPFCENAVLLLTEKNQQTDVALMLTRMGQCYNRSGDKDHAPIPLRAAVKIYRQYPGDPRLPAALIDLGNALRKSIPDEAERAYLEAADLYISKGQLNSATPAWVNLGILCSEQGRHAESLAWYQKALKARQSSPHTAPQKMGTLLNNMAGCYRRMGQFEEALDQTDRAIAIFNEHDKARLPYGYGTRGEILFDAGRDEEALHWLQLSYAERSKEPSPNHEAMIEILEFEIKALERLGRQEEAAAAQDRLSEIEFTRNQMPTPEFDLSGLTARPGGLVTIEIDRDSSYASQAWLREVSRLTSELSNRLEDSEAGNYSGRVIALESTTIFLRGEDAEATLTAVEPFLQSEKVFECARINLRQDSYSRNLVLPAQLN